tara:strand:- start:814 stop:1950 length:1137 start_codon:yes stop_codon:yes gene_type:complete
MECKKSLSLGFISDVTPQSFHNKEYRNYRTGILLSREESLLPDTQHIVGRINKARRMTEEIQHLERECMEIKKKIMMKRREQNILLDRNVDVSKKDRKTFIRRCGVDDCRGFLSTALKCGTCGTYSCKECLKHKNGQNDEEHKCNPDDIATAKLLAKETKPCPSCAVTIYKIEGCDQMWCVICHTAFSWKTGRIESGVIHNPHFYQWQRNSNNGVAPRVNGDIPCGGLPWTQTLTEIFKQVGEKFDKWEECYRSIHHIRQVVIRNNYREQDPIVNNKELRVLYLLKDISKEEWKKELQRISKKNEKNSEVRQVLNMYITVLTDLFCTFANGTLIGNLEYNCEGLKKYVNEQLYKINKNYKNIVPYIRNNWDVIIKHYK